MSYTQYEPVDPRDAFTVMARAKKLGDTDDEDDQSVAASQAALLLAIRSGVLGDTVTIEDIPEFPLPDVTALKRTRHVTVAAACQYLGASEKELRQEAAPALEQEMTRLTHELYDKPCLEAAAALFEAAMRSPHPLVAVAGASGARETTRLRPRIRKALEQGYQSDDRLTSRLAAAGMSQIELSLDLYALETGHYPENLQQLVDDRWIPGGHLEVPGHLLRYRPQDDGRSYSLALQPKS